MANIAIFRINYKSDFILTLNSDAGWMTPFCIKFWTGAPSQAYFAGYDGETYTHCAPVDGEPTKLRVQFDDHRLPIGDLKFQISYHFTVADFPTSVEDEVLNQTSVIIEVDDVPAQVMLDLNGETAPEIEFSLPAYANEAQRIANEQARIAAEQQRIANEDARIQAEETRQYNEQQRIQHEEERVSEFARLKSESEAATTAANAAATLANEKSQLADDKATLAQAAATLANEKAQLAADKAALAQAAATLANEKAALAQQKATYAQTQGDYAKEQGDYAKAQGDTAQADHVRAEADHTTAADDHSRAEGDHTTAASDHSLAESDHTTAASDHSLAESDHTTAASDHSRAESDHTTSASDHTRAEADHTTAASDHETAASDHTRAESDHAAVEVYVDSLGAFDISSYHATGGELAKYADLTAALGTDGANIPEGIRKGGMSVKYVCTYDNKYVQYRLMADDWSTTPSDWEKVAYDSEINGKDVEVSVTNYNSLAICRIADNGATTSVLSDNYSVMSFPIEYGKTYELTIPKITLGYTKAFAFHNLGTVAINTALTLPSTPVTSPITDYSTQITSPDETLTYLWVTYETSYGVPTLKTTAHVNGLADDIAAIEDDITDIGQNISQISGDLSALSEVVGDLSDEVDSLTEDVDETVYENEGEWDALKLVNKYAAQYGSGTYTPEMQEDTDINTVVLPPFGVPASGTYTIKYFIGYGSNIVGTASFMPTSKLTEVSRGEIEVTMESGSDWVEDFKIHLTNTTTIPSGNSVVVLLYAGNSNTTKVLGYGSESTQELPYNNKMARLLFSTTKITQTPFNETWYRASGGDTQQYKVCTPILKLETSSEVSKIATRVAQQVVQEEVPSIIVEELPSLLEEQVPPIVEDAIEEAKKVNVYLPDKIYAVVGDTLQLFYHGMVGVVNLSDYDIYVECSKGNSLSRYFTYRPLATDVGTTTLMLYVKDRNGSILGQASCNLVTVAAPTSPATNKSIFVFGDSLTSGGQWPGEAKRRLVAASTYDSIKGKELSNISFYGYMNAVINGQSIDYFGQGGWQWGSYTTKRTDGAFRFYVEDVTSLSIGAKYTNNSHEYTIQEINVTGGTGNIRCTTSLNTNTPTASGMLTKSSGDGDATITFASYETENANPLWDDVNNKMSFIPYVQDCEANTIDAVYALLSWNGQEAWKEYSADDTGGNIGNAKIFARTLHTEYPNAKLFIMGLQMPSMTGGLGDNYGASGGYIDGYGLKQCALNYNKALQDMCNLSEFSSYCEYVDIASQFDTLYNMPYTERAVNTRKSGTTEMIGTNGVHPSDAGYFQIADAVYRSIVANFCQSE